MNALKRNQLKLKVKLQQPQPLMETTYQTKKQVNPSSVKAIEVSDLRAYKRDVHKKPEAQAINLIGDKKQITASTQKQVERIVENMFRQQKIFEKSISQNNSRASSREYVDIIMPRQEKDPSHGHLARKL